MLHITLFLDEGELDILLFNGTHTYAVTITMSGLGRLLAVFLIYVFMFLYDLNSHTANVKM